MDATLLISTDFKRRRCSLSCDQAGGGDMMGALSAAFLHRPTGKEEEFYTSAREITV